MADHQLPLVQPGRPRLLGSFTDLYAPFSEVPARDVLGDLADGVSDATVLMLGCCDASCLLASLAEPHPALKQLTAVLDELHPLLLARLALLLLMVAELDPNSREDMQVLWEVWYCAAWGPNTLPRVKPFIEKLRTASVPWMTCVRPLDRALLQSIWGAWLTKAKQSCMRDTKARQKYKQALDSDGRVLPWRDSLLDGAVQQMVKLDSFEHLADTFRDGSTSRGSAECARELLQQVLQQDLATFFATGHLAPNYTDQQAAPARSVNITMAPIGAEDVTFNVYCSPTLCWGPFGADELADAYKTGRHSGLTARTCIARITGLVRSFQANTQLGPAQAAGRLQEDSSRGNRVQLQVQLTSADPLELCLGMPTQVATAVPIAGVQRKRQGTLQDTSVAVPLLYDVVDTSSLADRKGLLSLLVAAGSRLKPAAHARLYVALRLWPKNWLLSEFIFERAVHMPPSLTPTLLGLRLLTQLEEDRPETTGKQDYAYRVDNFRELVWTPIPREHRTSPLPRLNAQLLGGPAGSIEACLQEVATHVCCGQQAMASSRDSSREVGTPQLLAWLLASLAERTDMSALLMDSSSSSSSGTGSAGKCTSSSISEGHDDTAVAADNGRQAGLDGAYQQYAYMQRVLWALRTKTAQLLPNQYRLCFTAGIDILRSSLQQHAPREWQPKDVPLCSGVQVLSVPCPHHDKGGVKASDGVQHERRLVLVDSKEDRFHQADIPSPVIAMWGNMGEAVPSAGVHVVDTWALDVWAWRLRHVLKRQGQGHQGQTCLQMFIPSDHNLSERAFVRFAGSKDTKNRQGVPHGILQGPCVLAQLLLPATCAGTTAHQHMGLAEQPAQAASSQHAAAMKLQVVSIQEAQRSYTATLQLVDGAGRVVASEDPTARMFLRVNLLCLSYGSCAVWHMAGHVCDCNVQEPCATAHKVQVGFFDPTGHIQDAELQFCWPVATGRAEVGHVSAGSYSSGQRVHFRVHADAGQIEVEFGKAEAWEIWPSHGAWGVLPAPLDLSSLVPFTEAFRVVVQCCRMAQYRPAVEPEQPLLKQDPWKSDHRDRTAPGVGGRFDPLRVLLEDIMVLGTDGSLNILNMTRFTVHHTGKLSDGKEDTTMLHLLLHPPVLMTKAGRAVLPVTVLDASMCEGACASGDMDVEWYHSMLRRLGIEPGQQAPWSLKLIEGLTRFRRLLLRHALACQPMAAQQASLPDGQRIPYYYHSYVSFMQCTSQFEGTLSPTGSDSGRISGKGTHLKCRIKEIMSEVGRCDCQAQKLGLCKELNLLLQQDDSPLPAEFEAVISMLSHWWVVTGSTSKDVCEYVDTITSKAQLQGVDVAAKPSAAAAKGPSCMRCGKTACKLLTCGKCGAVQYCGRECQVAHWKQHKLACKPGNA